MSDKAWSNYEEVAAYLLDRNAKEFGLKRVDGKQSVTGQRSGTSWEIDAKGINANGEGFVIVECRRYTTSKQSQEKIGALAYRIIDTGASGGIIVTPLGLQAGAQKVASAEGIIEVELDANSTPKEFAMRFLDKLKIGMADTLIFGDSLTATVCRICKQCGERFEVQENEEICSTCAARDIT